MIRNDPVITGKCGKWSWVIVRKMIRNLGSLIAEYHVGQRLCITHVTLGGSGRALKRNCQVGNYLANS